MGTSLVRLEVSPKRLLNTHEAAYYCCLPTHDFKKSCPVQPLQITRGVRVFDLRDLDKWIDEQKATIEPQAAQ